MHADLASTSMKIGGMATTLVGIQRDIRTLQASVATLGAAVDDHTHRLDHMDERLVGIEKRLGLNSPSISRIHKAAWIHPITRAP